ncbi:MAG: hypothetical protein AB1861_30785 [Cyanobacteriota bacterium]
MKSPPGGLTETPGKPDFGSERIIERVYFVGRERKILRLYNKRIPEDLAKNLQEAYGYARVKNAAIRFKPVSKILKNPHIDLLMEP